MLLVVLYLCFLNYFTPQVGLTVPRVFWFFIYLIFFGYCCFLSTVNVCLVLVYPLFIGALCHTFMLLFVVFMLRFYCFDHVVFLISRIQHLRNLIIFFTTLKYFLKSKKKMIFGKSPIIHIHLSIFFRPGLMIGPIQDLDFEFWPCHLD